MTTQTTPVRRRLPDRRKAETFKLKIKGQSVFLTVGMYDDGAVGEIFVALSKCGSTLRTMADSWAKSVSHSLQCGMPLAGVVASFVNTQCEPCGDVEGHPDIIRALSLQDLIVRVLAIEYLGRRDLANAPVLPEPAPETVVDEVLPALASRPVPGVPEGHGGRLEHAEPQDGEGNGETCTTCGSGRLRRNGTCFSCLACGSTSGCS